MDDKGHRSGFAALIGRPNVGKSTLLNRLVGQEISIVTPKPQTTRNRLVGVVSKPGGQVALVDTPGIHQAKGKLNRFMVDVALSAASESDVNLFLVEAQAGTAKEVSEANRSILDSLQKVGKPALLVINKADTISKPMLLPLIDMYRHEFPFAEIVPISAKEGDGLELLLKLVMAKLPEGPPLFDAEAFTDQTERALVAELVREQVIALCREEVPYSSAVVIDEFDESEREGHGKSKSRGLSGLVRIFATLYVERESQKGIVIGKSGKMLKEIGQGARARIEQLLGAHVYLSLRVAVEQDWTDRPQGLQKMGYT